MICRTPIPTLIKELAECKGQIIALRSALECSDVALKDAKVDCFNAWHRLELEQASHQYCKQRLAKVEAESKSRGELLDAIEQSRIPLTPNRTPKTKHLIKLFPL